MGDISIELNKQAYAGGETVAGDVVLRLDEDTPLRGVRLRLTGYERASWTEGSSKNRHTHSESRDFFDDQIALQGRPRLGRAEGVAEGSMGAVSDEGPEVLMAGTYRYPFAYALPPDLPGSYESAQTGSRIHYGVKAEVDLPRKRDLRAEQSLIVHELTEPAAVQAVTQRETKKSLFNSDSLVEAAVRLDKDAFCLGEVVRCHLEVTNRSSKEIRAATLALQQLETAHADAKTHEERKEVTRARFEECRCPANGEITADLELTIPGDLHPTIGGTGLVRLSYELCVTLDIPRAVDARVSVPITVIRT